MNVIKEFEIEIITPKKDDYKVNENGKFLGFAVEVHNDTVFYSYHGVPNTEYTQDDILKNITPPKNMDFTGISNTFLMYLAYIRRHVQEMDMNGTGAQQYVASNGNGYQISLYFKLGPESPKQPKIDGAAAGYDWNVVIDLRYKNTGKLTDYKDTIFCLKAESAVHEALDRLFRKEPKVREMFDIVTPIRVSKDESKPMQTYGFAIEKTGE